MALSLGAGCPVSSHERQQKSIGVIYINRQCDNVASLKIVFCVTDSSKQLAAEQLDDTLRISSKELECALRGCKNGPPCLYPSVALSEWRSLGLVGV